MPGRMKFVPAVVHNLPHLGYRFEKWPSLPFAESCCSQYSCRRAGWPKQWIDRQEDRFLDHMYWREPLDSWRL